MLQVETQRSCRRCNALLARHNPEALCGPCRWGSHRPAVGPPALPPGFWQHETLQAAFRARHIGHVLRAFRQHPHHGPRGISQDDVAAWADIGQGQVSRTETGPPIDRLDRLVFWAELLGIPEEHLWFALPDDEAGWRQRSWPSPTAGPPASPSVPNELALADELGILIAGAADVSMGFLAGTTESNATDALIDDLRSDIERIAADYVHVPLKLVLQDLVVVRDVIFGLLERRQAPRHARERYLLAGISCALLANASHNVGDLRAALVQVKTACACADLAEHDTLRAWARGTAAIIAEWSQRPEHAVELTSEATRYVSTSESSARLVAIEARAAARAGLKAEALAAIRRLDDQPSRLSRDSITDFGGALSFPVAKQQFYVASAYELLGDHVAAERHALAAIAIYESGPPSQRSYGDEALVRVDLANARLAAGDLCGASDALAPVLHLPGERRIRQLDTALRRTRSILQQPRFADSRAGHELLTQLGHEYAGRTDAAAVRGGRDISDEEDVLAQACRQFGTSSAGARTLRRHSNAVYLLPSENAVVRIKPEAAERSTRAVRVARWLVDNDFPATAPLDVDQPFVQGPWTATAWCNYPQDDRPSPPPERLGELLRRLHDLPGPLFELPPYRPLTSLGEELRLSLGHLPAGDLTWLTARREELLGAYEHLEFPLDRGMIHGDAYPGNVLWDGDRVALGDWDEVAVGPRELDLANTYQGVRFGCTQAQLSAFAEAYGYDLARWPGLAVLRSLRDLHTLSAYLRRSRHGDDKATREVCRRIASLRQGDPTARWDAA